MREMVSKERVSKETGFMMRELVSKETGFRMREMVSKEFRRNVKGEGFKGDRVLDECQVKGFQRRQDECQVKGFQRGCSG
ncbi:hypothetical protein TNCV_3834711 [Trichonephila clavipes]|nr:hypothetical protein TNCV_3834711 [Trichonephila clavipes]